MRGQELQQFHVFLSGPGDVVAERDAVRAYFDDINRTAGLSWGIRFQVIDWGDFSTAGVGRPQELVNRQTLERFRESLALVVVVMARRFGSPTGVAESGTEEEVRWALAAHAADGYPEIKFFFLDATEFVAPADPVQLMPAVEQWQRVLAFRAELESQRSALVQKYSSVAGFGAVLRTDMDNWLHGPERPWAARRAASPAQPVPHLPPDAYFQAVERSYRSLDISGIDSDRAFELPLDKVYVRLRVIASDAEGTGAPAAEDPTFDIQTALERYPRLIIVGDPGSGKSTFLRFIALTLAQCRLDRDDRRAAEQLSLQAPLPVPVLVSCWDLAEHLRKVSRATLTAVIDFVAERLGETGWPVGVEEVERLLTDGEPVVLIDGLDEVPTEDGRRLVARLIDELVARYPRNRYVVTSRIRAYTGGTTLGQGFSRCDIQPFGREERTAFLQNWVDQLFNVRRDGSSAVRNAAQELNSLSAAIETSSIRSLAVNPLLLTVIAIVHWNRKRLPEQRVDLYDECIDVLLGQRKEAERHQASRDTRVLDEAYSEERLDQRAWVRKRFAEIAYAILSHSDEEIDRGAVVELLEPHFRDSSSAGSSRALAERFLDRQELRSGLLVRRRMSSYRFVHLTFQEYLAAWFLAGRDLASTLTVIAPHLRDPKWFEALQLLGGALANRSDEYLDRYVGWLLDQVGDGIREQAPVIALAANIVRDTHTMAKLSSAMQARYEALLRETFDAFEPDSRVPKQTQLELLEALGGLGASVKDLLVSATRSRLLDIRRRAVEMLVPHLSDDDLFALTHILADRSKEPIKTYLTAIVQRDRARAGRLVLDLSLHGDKTVDALRESPTPRLPADHLEFWPELLMRHNGNRSLATLRSWADNRPETWQLISELAQDGSAEALLILLGRADSPVPPLDSAALERIAQADPDTVSQICERQNAPGLLIRLAEAGAAQAVDVLIERWGERPEIRALVDRLARAGNAAALVDVLNRSEAGGSWAVLDEFGEADLDHVVTTSLSLSHVRFKWLVRALLTDEEHPNAAIIADRLIRSDWWALEMRSFAKMTPRALQLFARMAAKGNAAALDILVSRGGRSAETWHAIEHFTDDAVESLAKNDWWYLNHTMPLLGQRQEGTGLVVGLAAAGFDPALRYLLDGETLDKLALRLGGADAGADRLVGDLARAGHADALRLLLDHFGDRPDSWTLIADLGDGAVRRLAKGSRKSSSRLVGWLASRRTGHPEVAVLLRRLAAAGAAEALSVILAESANQEETWQLIDHLDDRAVQLLSRNANLLLRELSAIVSDRESSRRLVTRMAAVGSAEALRALLTQWPEHPQTVESFTHMAESGSGAAVEILLSPVMDTGLMMQLARHGRAGALELLINRQGMHDAVWVLIDELDQAAVDRLATEASPLLLDLLTGPWSDHDSSRKLVVRMTEAGSAQAFQALLDRWGWRDDTQDVVVRMARSGNAEALRRLLYHWGDNPAARALLAELAGPDSELRGPLRPWLRWALATGGVPGVQGLLTASW
ncbi:signal transduction protein [Actinoplanes sp. N902-109]|nr:signal transduction protein [Actinoplanes sp. N902-109]